MDTAAHAPSPFSREDFLRRAAGPGFPAFQREGALDPEAQDFLLQVHAHAASEAQPLPSPDDLLHSVHEFWAWSQTRRGEERLLRLRPAAGGTGQVIEIAGPDTPFLVDSVMAAVIEAGASAAALRHPVVLTTRDAQGLRAASGRTAPESLIQIELEPLAPGKAEAALAEIAATLADVALVVGHHGALRERMRAAAEALQAAHTRAAPEEVAEAVAFLRWLGDGNFIFLGARDYQYPRDAAGAFLRDEPVILEDTGLGLLSDPETVVLRRGAEPSVITPEIEQFLAEPSPLIVAKSNLRSRVHRRVSADYVGVKRFDGEGQVVGETRFVGLLAAEAYTALARDIPLLRRKAARVLESSGAPKGGHTWSGLRNILETYPRDELFQIGEQDLLATALAILALSHRPRPRLFVRRDRFSRFVSVLAFLPKDRFNSDLRSAVARRLIAAFGGRLEAFYPLLGEGPLARVHYLIHEIDPARPAPDIEALEGDIAALTRTWEDRFETAIAARADLSPDTRARLTATYGGAFTAAYRERFAPETALTDIGEIEQISAAIRVRAYRAPEDSSEALRCKVYSRGKALPLSATVPILENMGLYVIDETGLKIAPAHAAEPFWVHDIAMRAADGAAIDFETAQRPFEDAFAAAWDGRAENDAFNALILKLGVSWREAALIRALARFRSQTGLDPTQSVQQAALAAYPAIVAQLLALFRVRFDPAIPEPAEHRRVWAGQIAAAIEAALDKVSSLDADRVLRRLARLIGAITRTTFYQQAEDGAPQSYLAFKIASRDLEDLPEPKPDREIWVWSPQVEGVHLRFGPVARGGLRWSDRRDDFRTEVLDLVKAQQVKNAIIVPVGAKGGFFPKAMPRDASPAEARAVAIEAYKTFLSALLDLTDTIDAGGIVKPKDVVCWDGDDPYLVVAADKGTATFSDIANAISSEYGFWLGDAFASGGSAGYDHKAMGITARGAWEAVKRHFRELGKDIDTEAFEVIGVGDMSGDVFGNAMLLSRAARLVAAFDHRDIFLDPTPGDPLIAWAERKRLFDLPGSRWSDYNPALISPGGGVFSRRDKSIPLSPEVRARTGLAKDHVPPTELIAALLKAKCDLLFFGGVGTFVKAGAESHADVGDKANDGVRVDAEQVRALVIGEGANLGVTQRGRIAFARVKRTDGGGRINTDAIDNSAGVDTSDHEVNIKILLAEAMRTGDLAPEERAPLLAAMTEAVAAHVLTHNYDQTLALTLAEAAGASDLDAHERLAQRLEGAGKLNRAVEELPTTEGFAELRLQRAGLTRPEIAKLIAYAKIDLSDALVASAAPDDPHFEATLAAYFPAQLAPFASARARHRLRREIIATALADDIVNAGGPTFVDRVREVAQVEAPAIALAFEAARAIFDLDALRKDINALDNRAPTAAQSALHLELTLATRRFTLALTRRGQLPLGPTIALYREAAAVQRSHLMAALTKVEAAEVARRRLVLMEAGAPEALAGRVSELWALAPALDIADLARNARWPVEAAGALYGGVGAALRLDAIRTQASALALSEHWARLGLRRSLEEMGADQSVLAQSAIAHAGAPPGAPSRAWAEEAALAWLAAQPQAGPVLAAIETLTASGSWSFAKTVLAAAELRRLVSGASLSAGSGAGR